jgi:hypothetical protein
VCDSSTQIFLRIGPLSNPCQGLAIDLVRVKPEPAVSVADKSRINRTTSSNDALRRDWVSSNSSSEPRSTKYKIGPVQVRPRVTAGALLGETLVSGDRGLDRPQTFDPGGRHGNRNHKALAL